MKTRTKIASVFACLLSTCMTFTPLSVNAAEPLSTMSDDAILLSTGMPAADVYAMDEDIKGYIVDDLKASGKLDTMEYVEVEEVVTPVPAANQVLSGISFSVDAFQSAGTIYIYPTYEFTTPKKPDGEDSFAVQFGDAFEPYDYGGTIWTESIFTGDWEQSGDMVANNQGFNGAEYSGSQLGNPDGSILIKGCAYVHANEGNGSDNRMIMSYMYNPNSRNYSISFSTGGLGISYSSSSTIYTAARTMYVNY